VRLVASVPGYHRNEHLNRWGHMKLRAILAAEAFSAEFRKAPLVCQFSSLGSLNPQWLKQFTESLSAGHVESSGAARGMQDGPREGGVMPNQQQLGEVDEQLGEGALQLIWPTVEDVRISSEGYSAGCSIPGPAKNVQKEFLSGLWHRWNAAACGRQRAMPHIKSFCRYHGAHLAWFLLTSSNLSQAAWGALQKRDTQLMVRSYELGVVYLPSTLHAAQKTSGTLFCCSGRHSSFPLSHWQGISASQTPPAGPSSNADNNAEGAANTNGPYTSLQLIHRWPAPGLESCISPGAMRITVQVPYELPPEPYRRGQDEPWKWDVRYRMADWKGCHEAAEASHYDHVKVRAVTDFTCRSETMLTCPAREGVWVLHLSIKS
ncbi:hypothetical protein CYMTET_18388, partial [Cymbomonas tetramitiformis]